jgi:hypothetical protein
LWKRKARTFTKLSSSGAGGLWWPPASLNQVTGQKLTPEQQSLVQSLKEQVQKAMEAAVKTTNAAAKAVGGLLPTQK